MIFFTETDLKKIAEYADLEIDDHKYEELKAIYEKLGFLCNKIVEKGYEFSIRKDPRKQAGQGMFKFREYHWAQIYPQGFKSDCYKKFSYVIGLSDTLHFHMMGNKEYQDHPASIRSSQLCWTNIEIRDSNYEKLVAAFCEFEKNNRNLFIDTAAELGIQSCAILKEKRKMENYIKLLFSKKQIILQGPPGTGKTRLSKLLAQDMTFSFLVDNLTLDNLTNYISEDMVITTVSDKREFKINRITDKKIKVQPTSSPNEFTVNFHEVINCFKESGWNENIKKYDGSGTGSYIVGLANYIKDVIENPYLKLIQFHPSYSYEDFVRGISAKSTGAGIEYKAENKILAEFASIAHQNYIDSRKDIRAISKEKWILEKFDDFKDFIQDELDDKDKFMISEKVFIFEVEDDAFRYKGDNWSSSFRMPFTEILKLFHLGVNERKEIKKQNSVIGRAKQHATYYFNLLQKFKAFISDKPFIEETVKRIEEKNYVLIIDEINRANLPSVLGELIYALEYRGEAVESMYEIEGKGKQLTLTPNLYIIGTMNSADRSVGHIDYAIRRRFAFVPVPPDVNVISEVIKEKPLQDKAIVLFNSVSELFTKKNETSSSLLYLAPDFKAEDVQIGHSYFLAENEEKLKMKLKYEIKPILHEYIKDGILNDIAREIVDNLHV